MTAVGINEVLRKLQTRINAYNSFIASIESLENADSEHNRAAIRSSEVVVAELKILKENFEDLKYKIELGL